MYSHQRVISPVMDLGVADAFHRTVIVNMIDLTTEAALAVTVVTTDLQKVFLPNPSPLPMVPGPTFFTIKGAGVFTNLAGAPKTVHLNLRPDRFEILGLIGGGIKSLVEGDVHFWPPPKK